MVTPIHTLKQSVSGYDSACKEAILQSATAINPFEDYYKAAFGSSIFIAIVSLTTVLTNSLLLFVFLRRRSENCSQPNNIFSDRFGHCRLDNSPGSRTHIPNLFCVPLLSTSFHREMPTSRERWKVSRRFCYDGILSNRLRLP